MTVNHAVRREYDRLRRVGFAASYALTAARTQHQWQRLEDAGLARLLVIPDDHPDLSWLNDAPPHYRRAATRRVEQDGVWGIVGQYRHAPDGEWRPVDSCFGFVGDDYRDSGYDTDIKHATITAFKDAMRSRCPNCRQTRPGQEPS